MVPTFTRIPVERYQCFMNTVMFMHANPCWTLVHGICFGSGGEALGRWFGHAWCEKKHERTWWVYCPSKDILVPREQYYAFGRISYTRRYLNLSMMIRVRSMNTYGPWDKKLLETAGHQE